MEWVLAALALALTGYLWARLALARRAEAEREAEREGYRRVITRDPKNSGAHEALGDSLRAAGRLAEAREAYLGALVAGGAAPNQHAQYKLRQIDLALAEREAGQTRPAPELVFCRRCAAANPPARRVCENCDAPLPYDTFRAALGDREVRMAGLEALACGIVLLIALRVASAQPLEVKGCLIMATAIVAGWRILRAIGNPTV